MPANRIQKLACTVTAGIAVFVALAVQTGPTTAAALTSSASAGGAARGKVRIELKGTVLGARGHKGRFTLSGALADRGRFVDLVELGGGNRTLYGARGTMWIRIRSVDDHPSWRITKGSGAYARLRGRGTQRGLYGGPSAPRVRITMIGTVWR